MKIHVTDLDQLLWFRKLEAMTLDEIVSRLRREAPANRAMLMGTAWHSVMESPPEDEFAAVERDGFNFLVDFDAEITLPQVREIRAEKTYSVDGIAVTLTGGCDGITGNEVIDHKLTARPDPEKYFDSYQWRAYLDIYDADIFRYVLWHCKDEGERVLIRSVSELPLYRYPNMRDDLLAGIHEFVSFAKVHLPERFEKEAA